MLLETINWKTENDIGYLMLDMPPANTMTQLFFEELGFVIHNIIPEADIKALIIYGNGRHFSSGVNTRDLKHSIIKKTSSAADGEIPGFLKETAQTFVTLEKLTIPTFAAIRGTCLGSAMELALFCKFRICGEGTVLGFPESSFGLMPGCGGSVKLPRIVGRSRAMELLLSGRTFSASEAYSWGIVHKIVNRKTLLEDTVDIASKIIKN